MIAPLFNAHWSLERRRELRKAMTRAEKIFWICVRGSQLGVKFRRQFNIGPYIADFYAPKARLVIELDGESHDDAVAKAYDSERDNYMTELDFKVLRFTNRDIEDRLDDVLAAVRSHVRSAEIPPPYQGGG